MKADKSEKLHIKKRFFTLSPQFGVFPPTVDIPLVFAPPSERTSTF